MKLFMTRARTTDRMRIGTLGWYRDGHLMILVQKTGRGFVRQRVLDTEHKRWWSAREIRTGLFRIPVLTRLVTDKRVKQLAKELGV